MEAHPKLEDPSRRRFLVATAAATLGASYLGGEAHADSPVITEAVIGQAEQLTGIRFSEAERSLMRESVQEHLGNLEAVRALQIANDVPPAMRFRPAEGLARPKAPESGAVSAVESFNEKAPLVAHDPLESLAFASLPQLAELLRRREIRSVDLTRMHIERMKRLDDTLHFVINLPEERALEDAARADSELDAGQQRSPLHGIPYGAKDLLAARGAKTTWGAMPFRDQQIDEDADVIQKLSDAGAILAAKTSVGALAWGDVWFGATTRNPWNPEQGSSGSSAGSASTVAAGALPFALGTETLGSLVSPSTRCGVTSIRPTFGRVSRGGCMALTWSMDKIGPIARSVADCALVLDAMAGASPRDPDSIDAPLHWPKAKALGALRIGFVESAFAADRPQKVADNEVLATLRRLGVQFEAIELPEFPVSDLMVILEVEAAAAFEELTVSGRDDELVRQIANAWPNVFRAAQLVSGVQYVQAQRARTLLMRQYEQLFADIDVYACPSFGSSSLGATNLTGHPAVVLPNGFTEDGAPTSVTFTSGLYAEGDAARVAHSYQVASGWHLKRPQI